MSTPGSLGETIHLPADPQAPGAARAFLRARLADSLDPERLQDVELIATELVTNAVQHGSNPGDRIELTLEHGVRTLYLSVTDKCRKRSSPAVFGSNGERESGRGLLAVERLAERWSDEIVQGERRVWATVSLS